MALPKAKRANRKTSQPSPREKKVAEIVRLMTQGVWGPVQARTYCDIWHLEPQRMKEYAAEASRILRFLISSDKEEIRSMIAASLQHVVQEATKDRKWSAVVQALHAQSELWGTNAPVQLDIRTEFEQMSEDELLRKKAELLGQLSVPSTDVRTPAGKNAN